MARIREGDLGSGVDFLGTNLSPDMPSLHIFKFCPSSTSKDTQHKAQLAAVVTGQNKA